MNDLRKSMGLKLKCTSEIDGHTVTVSGDDVDSAKEKALQLVEQSRNEHGKLSSQRHEHPFDE